MALSTAPVLFAGFLLLLTQQALTNTGEYLRKSKNTTFTDFLYLYHAQDDYD